MKTKVLHIITSLSEYGGAERLVVDLYKYRNEAKFDISVCSLHEHLGIALENEFEMLGGRIFYLNKRIGPDFRLIRSLANLIGDLRPDVVHTHLNALMYAYVPLLIKRTPVCIHTIHSEPKQEIVDIGRVIHRIAFRSKKVIPVSISNNLSDHFRATYGNINNPVIINGTDIDKFKLSSSDTLRNELGLKDEIIIMNIASFKLAKNHMLLIDAFHELCKRDNRSVLVLVGDGALRRQTEDYISELNINNRVIFLGEREDIPQLLHAADIFVLSSLWEGIPITILEAMAAGKPIVSTNVGGISELIEHEKSGLLVPSGNKAALADALFNLIKDPETRNNMGHLAKERSHLFDIRRTARQYEDLYVTYLNK